MIDGIKNFIERATTHKPGDAKGRSLDKSAWETAIRMTGSGFGGKDPRQIRYVAAREAIAGFIDADAIHVPTSDESEQVLIATGLDPHTATIEQVKAAMPEIYERLLGHVCLIQGIEVPKGVEDHK